MMLIGPVMRTLIPQTEVLCAHSTVYIVVLTHVCRLTVQHCWLRPTAKAI